MRQLLTQVGHFDRCVTEFIRVTHTRLPAKVFQRYCPELNNDGYTHSGVPVYIQLLGGNSDMMAHNAKTAAQLGARGIDINFGCPAKTVNRHEGGSVLLQTPERIASIVRAVRDAVHHETPVSVKIRLGYHNSDLIDNIVQGITDSGANELCIHARTKSQGYKPPAHWPKVLPLQTKTHLPLIINGEIWTVDDAYRAQNASGCQDIMLGRGSLACPDLSMKIKASADNIPYTPLLWLDILELLQNHFNTTVHTKARHTGNRLKQWLIYLCREYPDAQVLFNELKTFKAIDTINQAIDDHRQWIRSES